MTRSLPGAALVGTLLALAATGVALATVGQINEFQVPAPGGPNAVTVGPDGAVWFTELARPAIGRRTLSGTYKTFMLPTQPTTSSIVSCPNGPRRFTQSYGRAIGRITDAGQYSALTG